jgi:GT2 family glycosyltransferase
MKQAASPAQGAEVGVSRPPRVVVAVLTWNGYGLARACLESLRTLDSWPLPVIVVDNGSETNEGEQLASEFGPPVSAIRLDSNRGVPGGYNAAIARAHEIGAAFVLLLNNDTLVADPHFLDMLVANAVDRVAAVGPQILERDGRTFSFGGMLNYWTGVCRHRRVRLGPEAYGVPWIDGSCMLVSVNAACELGGLHEAYWSTWEELDWCVRATRAGWRIVVEPRTSITHLRGASIPSGMQNPFAFRNGMLFIRRNGSSLQNLTSMTCFLLGMVPLQIALAVYRRRPVVRVLRNALAALKWNVTDAIHRRHWRLEADGPTVCQLGDRASNPREPRRA